MKGDHVVWLFLFTALWLATVGLQFACASSFLHVHGQVQASALWHQR